tara:strand:- start:1430 stop:3094 length:1665 start_codon:yes stop_codon:yes gene_type:complete
MQYFQNVKDVMKLRNLGSYHPTRLSFSRQLIITLIRENWIFKFQDWKINKLGKGYCVISVENKKDVFSLIIFSHLIKDEERSDRVIAEKWDFTFSLFTGIPNEKELKHLKKNVPLQENGNHLKKQLTLSRANKSTRLFNHFLENLSNGLQPEFEQVKKIGYLLRTTAVYGNGKFGIGDYNFKSDSKILRNGFWAEMLTVYMLKIFSIEYVNFLAKNKSKNYTKLNDNISDYLGTGNATGLGMAPFVVNHPKLIHKWINTKQTLIKIALDQKTLSKNKLKLFLLLLENSKKHINQWEVEDKKQKKLINQSRKEIDQIINSKLLFKILNSDYPLKKLLSKFNRINNETREMLYSIFLELYPKVTDSYSGKMNASDKVTLNTNYSIAKIKSLIKLNYGWALNINFNHSSSKYFFWYVSETKQEPRLGLSKEDHGYEKRLPLDIAKQISDLNETLKKMPNKMKISEFCLKHHKFKSIIKRVLINEKHQFSEIHENLEDKKMRPIDILRFKLSFFGACKFDPKSNLWTRITLFQGVPLPKNLKENKTHMFSFPFLNAYG